MAKIIYVITRDPKADTEIVSAVLAQAITAVSFDYECEIFLMGEAVAMGRKGGLGADVKYATFESIDMMIENFMEMDGKIFICHPSSDARGIHEGDEREGVKFVNASLLLAEGKDADAVFTF